MVTFVCKDPSGKVHLIQNKSSAFRFVLFGKKQFEGYKVLGLFLTEENALQRFPQSYDHEFEEITQAIPILGMLCKF